MPQCGLGRNIEHTFQILLSVAILIIKPSTLVSWISPCLSSSMKENLMNLCTFHPFIHRHALHKVWTKQTIPNMWHFLLITWCDFFVLSWCFHVITWQGEYFLYYAKIRKALLYVPIYFYSFSWFKYLLILWLKLPAHLSQNPLCRVASRHYQCHRHCQISSVL